MLTEISMRMFGGLVRPYLMYFESLETNLKRGMLRYGVQEYISMLLFFSALTFVGSMTVGSVVVSFAVASAVGMGSVLFNYTLTMIISFVAAAGVFFMGYYYPSSRANSVKIRLERNLPFSVFFMATTASSGIHPLEIFKTLSQKKGVVGEEAMRIYTGVKTMGMSLNDAMAKVANRSPSASFADLLWGMISVITSGGDLEDYLNSKTRTFMTQYRLSLNDYAKKVALYTEIYITLVMVGSLFFIVLTAIMSPLGGMEILMLQTFVVFFLTPLVSVAFIVILKGSSPVEE